MMYVSGIENESLFSRSVAESQEKITFALSASLAQATNVHTFFLDLASHSGSLICVDDDRVVASVTIDHRVDDAALVPHAEGVLSAAKWNYTDLTQIACVVGPGGFTSLRVAVALSNTLSHELKIPLCGVHLSELYAARVDRKSVV